MPAYVHHTFEGGGIAIWHITESSDALYALLGTSRYDAPLAVISHEARRTEWLAVRVLVATVLGEDKEIAYHSSGRPYLIDGSYSISISHTKGYAAIAYHRTCSIGLDVERIASRVERIAHRFTHPDEAVYIDVCSAEERLMRLLVSWSAKETLYKLADCSAAADFREAFRIAPYELAPQGILDVYCSNQVGLPSLLSVEYRLNDDFICTWACLVDK